MFVMPDYISNSACHGRRPLALRSRRDYSRPNLASMLIRERDVARFICAPPGYGKTAVALEYAELVFALSHMFWFDAASPCFLRDLDSGELCRRVNSTDEMVSLVVFEDVPLLSPTRAQAFSRVLDDLMEAGSEVLVTCTPSADVYEALQRDRVLLRATDLLLTDEEVGRLSAVSAGQQVSRSARQSIACRIPGIAWNTDDLAHYAFLEGIASEELSGSVALAACFMLLAGTGDITQLEGLCPQINRLVGHLADDYPHFGIDKSTGQFAAVSVDAPDVLWAFRAKIDGIIAASSFENRNDFGIQLADTLMAQGKAARALDVIDRICGRTCRGLWIVENARGLVRQAVFAPTLAAVQRLEKTRIPKRTRMRVIVALFLAALGENEASVSKVKQLAFDPGVEVDLRMSALALVLLENSNSLRERAYVELDALLDGGANNESLASFWGTFARGVRARMRGFENLTVFCDTLLSAGDNETSGENASPTFDEDALCLLVAWLFDDLKGSLEAGAWASASAGATAGDVIWPFAESEFDAMLQSCLRKAVLFTRSRLSACAADIPDYFTARAAIGLERVRTQGIPLMENPFPVATLMALHDVGVSIALQKKAYQQQLAKGALEASVRLDTNPDSYLSTDASALESVAKKSVPCVSIRLFGRLEVWIGNRSVDERLYHNRSIRELLILLALNLGREVPRQLAATTLWPESTEAQANRNFYSTWSKLRTLLTLSDGTCPYLRRHAQGISLEPRYVHTDYQRLSEICREFLFGEPNLGIWTEMYREIDLNFSCELVPFERDTPAVASARTDCRRRLVDALVAATYRMVEEGDARSAVWFARSALSFDKLREDIYLALMIAQASSGQRTAAMDTFLECREVLSEYLGIDPSPETLAYYEGLLGVDRAA